MDRCVSDRSQVADYGPNKPNQSLELTVDPSPAVAAATATAAQLKR